MNAPKMPDPMKTAQAQTQMNKDTAIAQQNLNMVDQTGPLGSTTYKQIGTNPDGTPKFGQTTALNGQAQSVVDNTLGTLSQPFTMDTDAIESRLMDLSSKRVNPMLEQRRVSTEQSLMNRGVRPGTEAYDRAMRAVTEGENDQWNQLALGGRNQAISELLQGRNQPLNEMNAMLGGNQMNAPTPQAGVAPTDYSGLVGQKYAADSQAYGDMWSGLGNLAGAGLGGWASNGFKFSDERLKTDVRDTGSRTSDGIPIKSYRYKGSPMMELGVIAQEAKKERPDAVKRGPGGFMMVNYDKVMS